MTLDVGVAVDEHYVCVYTKEVNVRQDFGLDSPILHKLRHGQTVHGVLARRNEKGHMRLQLEDGTWTSIHAGVPSDPFLRVATLVTSPYVCMQESVNVRKGFHLDTDIVRTLKCGDVVRGAAYCTNKNRVLRLQLDDGTWTSIHGGTPSEPLLRAASFVDESYICAEEKEVNVREGFQLDSAILRTLRRGDVAHGCLTCLNAEGVLRLRLEDGGWTSVHGRDGAFLVSVSRLLEERARDRERVLCQVCMDRPKRVAFGCGHQCCEADPDSQAVELSPVFCPA